MRLDVESTSQVDAYMISALQKSMALSLAFGQRIADPVVSYRVVGEAKCYLRRKWSEV